MSKRRQALYNFWGAKINELELSNVLIRVYWTILGDRIGLASS
jgi:hypothetical protein